MTQPNSALKEASMTPTLILVLAGSLAAAAGSSEAADNAAKKPMAKPAA